MTKRRARNRGFLFERSQPSSSKTSFCSTSVATRSALLRADSDPYYDRRPKHPVPAPQARFPPFANEDYRYLNGRAFGCTESFKSTNSSLWRQLTASGPSPNTFFLSPGSPHRLERSRATGRRRSLSENRVLGGPNARCKSRGWFPP